MNSIETPLEAFNRARTFRKNFRENPAAATKTAKEEIDELTRNAVFALKFSGKDVKDD